MIDTHIHIDLFKDPIGTACRIQESLAAAVAVTMLPSHYALAKRHLVPFRKIYPAIGAHPLMAKSALAEVKQYIKEFSAASFIGEIGLDKSREGLVSFDEQVAVFQTILKEVSSGSFVTVHSRDAEIETLALLRELSVGPVCFHYFTGGVRLAQKLIDAGHFISLNHKMLKSARHLDVLNILPSNRILLESDSPFLGVKPIEQLKSAVLEIGRVRQIDVNELIYEISTNFYNCRTK